MIDTMTMQVNPAPKAKQTTSPKDSYSKEPAVKDTKEDKQDFKDLVEKYSQKEKTEKPKTKVEAPEDDDEKTEKPNENAQQVAMQMLMDMFSFTQEDAKLVLDEMINTGNSEQLAALMPMLGDEKKAQLAQILNMLNSQQNGTTSEDGIVSDFAAKLTQELKPNQDSPQNNGNKTVVVTEKGEGKQNIQQSSQANVENSAKATENQLSAQASFKSAVKEAKAMLGESKQGNENETVDVDKLQQQAESFKLAGGIRYVASTAQTDMSQKELQNSVASQVKTGIVQNLNASKGLDNSEFIIKLRPEGLGEITVKLSQVGKDITLNIITQKADTQKLLNAEIMQLRDALKPYNAQIEQVSAKTDIDYGSFSGGSEQFFGRNGSWQSGSNSNHYYGSGTPDEDGAEQDAVYQEAQDEFIYA